MTTDINWYTTPKNPNKIKKRYLEVRTDKLHGLCPRSSYTLTFHQYNNVANKCKYVGPLLSGSAGIITESLAIGSQGDLVQKFSTKDYTKIPLSLLPTQYNEISALGGSCVLTLNENCVKKPHNKGKKGKCAPSCPSKLCAPIQL